MRYYGLKMLYLSYCNIKGYEIILKKVLDKILEMAYYINNGEYTQKGDQRAHLLLCGKVPESQWQTQGDLAKISRHGRENYPICGRTQDSEANTNKDF